jgi:hypothetical protein
MCKPHNRADSMNRGDGLSYFFREGCFGMFWGSYCLFLVLCSSLRVNLSGLYGSLKLNTSVELQIFQRNKNLPYSMVLELTL